MNLEVKVAGLALEHPIMNAAGTCKGLDGNEGLRVLLRSATSGCMMGSVTIEPRGGNPGSVYYAEEGFSQNSLGLPNPGMPYYCQHLPEMAKLCHDAGKLLLVSTAGFSPQENAVLTDMAFAGGADIVEENFGCPNVWVGSEQKPIASFVPDLIAETLKQVTHLVGPTARVAVKLSPFSNPFALEDVAKVINDFAVVKTVTTTNTFPNTLSLDETGKPRITVGVGLAGLGGAAMKPIGLGQVKQLRKVLRPDIQIIGVGGIRTGQDVLDYLRAGADAVAVATAKLQEGDGVFTRLLDEFIELQEKANV